MARYVLVGPNGEPENVVEWDGVHSLTLPKGLSLVPWEDYVPPEGVKSPYHVEEPEA